MSSFREKIFEDLKQAMRDKNAEAVSTLRLMTSAFLVLEKSQDKDANLDESEYMNVLQKELKKRQESFDIYTQAGRTDLAEQEKKEMEVIARYLPTLMTEEEIDAFVSTQVSTLEDKSLGSVMKAVMPGLKGKADGKLVNQVVQKYVQ